MPVTLQDVIRRVREDIDEPTAHLWTDTGITDWINDGARDLSRKAEDLMVFDTSIAVVAGTAKYALQSDLIRVHRMEFVPSGSTQTYPLTPSSHGEMDGIWGINQSQASAYPSFFVTIGYPGGTGTSAMKVQLFPVPSASGTLNVFYYKLPYRFLDPEANAVELAKSLEVPEGWDDLVVLYAQYRAMRKDRDPRWQEAKQLYDEQLDHLINVTRFYHDQEQMMTVASRAGVPNWLTEWWE